MNPHVSLLVGRGLSVIISKKGRSYTSLLLLEHLFTLKHYTNLIVKRFKVNDHKYLSFILRRVRGYDRSERSEIREKKAGEERK